MGSILAIPTDVARLESVEALRNAVLDRFGEVSVLMNNAGTGGGGSPWQNYGGWQRVLGVNLWGVVHGCKLFLPHLKAAGEGHIVNTASMAGLVALPAAAPFHARENRLRASPELMTSTWSLFIPSTSIRTARTPRS